MKKSLPVSAAIFSLIFLILIVVGYATHIPEHNKAGDCGSCHLNDPQGTLTPPPGPDGLIPPTEPVELLFTEDIVQICARCHPDAATLSHPIGTPVTGTIPPEFPLDWKDETTCTTCHFFHNEQNVYFLRSDKAGKEFCLLCHPMEFFTQMKDAGESLVEAHLISGLEAAVELGFIDPVSLECLGCHDGVTASEVKISVSATGYLQHESASSHPIGTDYAEYANIDTSVTPIDELPKEVLLVDGKVGCPTCHESYKEVHGALVITKQGSKLCFTCHRM
jgi:predicted CXXCH cytochrome family protein